MPILTDGIVRLLCNRQITLAQTTMMIACDTTSNQYGKAPLSKGSNVGRKPTGNHA
jgi:hypothetical protein